MDTLLLSLLFALLAYAVKILAMQIVIHADAKLYWTTTCLEYVLLEFGLCLVAAAVRKELLLPYAALMLFCRLEEVLCCSMESGFFARRRAGC